MKTAHFENELRGEIEYFISHHFDNISDMKTTIARIEILIWKIGKLYQQSKTKTK